MRPLTTEFVTEAVEDKTWDLANCVLYRLCTEHPDHTCNDANIAKVWLIGRAYAAAVERRRKKDNLRSDEFYAAVIGPTFRQLDAWFAEFKERRLTPPQLHKKIVELLKDMTYLEKRSFVSKYL